MDFKKFTSNAGSFFERTVQKAEETFKTADKTLLDAGLENLMKECDLRQKWAHNLVNLTTNFVQPNPAMKFEDMVLKGFDRKKERSTAAEQLGDYMTEIANEMGTSVQAGSLLRCGQAQYVVGQSEKVMLTTIEETYIKSLQDFISGSVKQMKKDREELENVRLDLDRIKTKIRRAKDDAAKKHKSPSDALPPQLEQEKVEATATFDRQCDVTRQSCQNCIADFDRMQNETTKMLEAQRTFHQKALGAVQDALRQ